MYRNYIFHLHTRSENIQKKHFQNTSKSLQKPLKNQSQTRFKKRFRKSCPKSASKYEKVPKMVQNGVPKRGASSSLFRTSWPLGSPWAPTWPPELPKEVPGSSQASILLLFGTRFLTFLVQFKHFLHTLLQQIFYIFPNDFLHFFKWIPQLRFTGWEPRQPKRMTFAHVLHPQVVIIISSSLDV